MFASSTCRSFAFSKSSPHTLIISSLIPRQRLNQVIRGTKNLPPPDKQLQNRVKHVWTQLFGKYLLTTNTISSGILMAIGDFAAQELEYRRGILKERYDLARLWRMFLVGSLQGPLHHYAYRYMDKVMPVVSTRNTVNKLLIDQILLSPIGLLLFFYPACLLENKTLRESTDEIMNKFSFVYIADCCVWPAAQFINFHYLDPKYRVMYVNVLTALYNVFISYIKHDEDGNFLDKFIQVK